HTVCAGGYGPSAARFCSTSDLMPFSACDASSRSLQDSPYRVTANPSRTLTTMKMPSSSHCGSVFPGWTAGGAGAGDSWLAGSKPTNLFVVICRRNHAVVEVAEVELLVRGV